MKSLQIALLVITISVLGVAQAADKAKDGEFRRHSPQAMSGEDNDTLNDQFGYLAGKRFVSAAGSVVFEDGHFQFESAQGASKKGRYVVQAGQIRLVAGGGREPVAIQVDIATNTVKDLSSGLVYLWETVRQDAVAPNPVYVSPYLVSAEAQYAFLAGGRSFAVSGDNYAAIIRTGADGSFDWWKGINSPGSMIAGTGRFYIDNGAVYMDFGTNTHVPILVFPDTQSFLLNPDSSLRGLQAVDMSSRYGLTTIEDLRGKLFKGETGMVAFSNDTLVMGELVDYSSTSDPFFSVLTTELVIRNGLLALSSKLDDGTLTESTIFLDKKYPNELIVNGRQYFWLGEFSTTQSEQVLKPALTWLVGKAFTSAQGSKLSFPLGGSTYVLVSPSGKTDTGLVSLGLTSVFLHHTLTDSFPLEVDVTGEAIIFKGETFQWSR